MRAVESPRASVELVRLLIERGASVHKQCKDGLDHNVVALCLHGGDPRKLTVLLENGADLHYKRTGGYDALIDAACARIEFGSPRLIGLLNILIASGVALNSVTQYRESALRILSRIGRFDGIKLLLKAGADPSGLAWTPLINAVALGSLADVENAVRDGAPLEERDWWDRTAWLVAIQTGDVAKTRFLLERRADPTACGRCGKPSLFYAIEAFHTPMLRWLLEFGTPVEQADEFGKTALMTAAECGNAEAVDILLHAGADGNRDNGRESALADANTARIATRLLDAGADPARLSSEGRRALLGLEPEADASLLNVSDTDFRKACSRRFGVRNPEEMVEPFWEGMIRAGISAYQGAQLCGGRIGRSPVWCAQRFGQSITFLPDGRIVQIAGEHEDSYDEDFCIYNDVFVHDPDGAIHIFGYPESEFPPTDFHTATLAGEWIYIIGSVGYCGARRYGETPVYRLNTRTFRIERVEASGEAPGWIHNHRAMQTSADEIRVTGGEVATLAGSKEICTPNERRFVLDTKRCVWRAA